MIKFLYAIIATVFCIALGLIPEAIMYGVYSLINPTTELVRILVLCAFWFGGAGLCVAFATIAFLLWAHIMKEIL